MSIGSLTAINGQSRHIIGGPTSSVLIKRQKVAKPKKACPIHNLAGAITKGLRTDEEKSLAIFNWITTNITYDHQLMFEKDLQNTIYTSESNVVNQVLKRRKALCGGFAFLYRDLCAAVGIQSKAIHGYTKTPGLQRKTNNVHHTWNVVKLNGQWTLLDITWAKSHSTNNFPNRFWYATTPEDFIKTHLPEEPQWTLLDYKWSLREFDSATQK